MIKVYSWATPNGHKVHTMLEEFGLGDRAIPVDIGAGDPFKPEFLAISPNNKIPAIVDPQGPDGTPISLFESGAIRLCVAGKTGQFLPDAITRHTQAAKRLYGVLDRRLARSRDIGGAQYSIADIAIHPWLRAWKNQGIDWADHPHLKGWFDEIGARPAVKRGVEVLADLRKPLTDDTAREVLFGARQQQRH